MYCSTSSLSALVVMVLSASTFVAATPISMFKPSTVPCTDVIRDAILNGQMAPSECCVEGLCLGDGNSAARFASQNTVHVDN